MEPLLQKGWNTLQSHVNHSPWHKECTSYCSSRPLDCASPSRIMVALLRALRASHTSLSSRCLRGSSDLGSGIRCTAALLGGLEVGNHTLTGQSSGALRVLTPLPASPWRWTPQMGRTSWREGRDHGEVRCGFHMKRTTWKRPKAQGQ